MNPKPFNTDRFKKMVAKFPVDSTVVGRDHQVMDGLVVGHVEHINEQGGVVLVRWRGQTKTSRMNPGSLMLKPQPQRKC